MNHPESPAITSNLEPSTSPLVVIVGETGSGKSALALGLAEQFAGEIICADSRTVYKGLDIGTAKPSKQDQQRVPHHLLDIVEPDQRFTVADFKQLATKAIQDIQARSKLPIMVGGTGLYVDALLYNFEFAPPELAQKRDPLNPRHLDKTIKPLRSDLRPNTLLLGLKLPQAELTTRLTSRTEAMLQQGLEQEVKGLSERYGWEIAALKSVGYREWQAYFASAQTFDQTKDLIIKHSLDYAKRQRTWFKRNPSIQWLQDPSKAVKITSQFLSKKQ